jgi:[protein-PII] uridylyltransferase
MHERVGADITVQTSLLEARLVTGDAPCSPSCSALPRRSTRRPSSRPRPPRCGCATPSTSTPRFRLEPNCKESPGALRDLQVILWVAKAAGLANSWSQLATRGLITRDEARQLMEKERAFKDIRVRLHLQTNRREDRLLFDVQTAIAESFGLTSTATVLDARRASEYLMQRYYWAAKTVTQLNTILLQNIEARLFPQPSEPVPINACFNEVNGFIDIAATTPSRPRPPPCWRFSSR